jgi:microcin C transport system substrate-binding protein
MRYCMATILLVTLSIAVAGEKSHGLSLYGPQDLKYKEGQSYRWANKSAAKGGILNLSSVGAFTKLNPLSLKGTSAPLLGNCFETLGQSSLDPEEPFVVYGSLAEYFELGDEAMTLTCHLNKNAYFSDGAPVRADDVVFSFNLIFDPQYTPGYRSYFSDIEKAEKIDDRTVKFTFKALNKELPLIITSGLIILPKHVYGVEGKDFGKDFDESLPVGSGPYKVKAYDKGAYITYERDKKWWAKDLPLSKGRYNFDTIKSVIFLDPVPERQALKSGMIDAKQISSSKDWHHEFNGDYFKNSYSVRRLFTPMERVSNMQGFALNLRREKFKDIRVRKALGAIFDFEHMNKNLFYSQYERCLSFWNGSKEMSTRGPAKGDERKILVDLSKRFNKPKEGVVAVPKDAVIRGPYAVGTAPDGSVFSIYDRILAANSYLDKAGWKYDAEVGARRKGDAILSIEFMLYGPGFQRICNPYIELLAEIGVKGRIQIVQPAEFVKRIKTFDYDIITSSFGGNSSPGNELKNWFHSASASVPGSRNHMGISNPAVDEVIDKIVVADNRKSLVLYTKVLDRILCANHYMIPQWYTKVDRAIYWQRIQGPKVYAGKGAFESEVINFWWFDEARSKRLNEAMANDVPFVDQGEK